MLRLDIRLVSGIATGALVFGGCGASSGKSTPASANKAPTTTAIPTTTEPPLTTTPQDNNVSQDMVQFVLNYLVGNSSCGDCVVTLDSSLPGGNPSGDWSLCPANALSCGKANNLGEIDIMSWDNARDARHGMQALSGDQLDFGWQLGNWEFDISVDPNGFNTFGDAVTVAEKIDADFEAAQATIQVSNPGLLFENVYGQSTAYSGP